jgi:2-methylcitrate dehydratase PrpD
MMHNCIKQYPTNASQQAPINGLASLIEEHRFSAEDVERIDVGLNKTVAMHCGSVYEPQEVIQAQFSLAYSLAIRLIKGSNDLSLYMDRELWRDPHVMELAHKIHFYPVPEIRDEQKHGCRIRITVARGKTLEANLEYPKGSFKNPLSKEELRSKFRNLAASVLPADRIEKVIGTVERMEQIRDVSEIVSLLVK